MSTKLSAGRVRSTYEFIKAQMRIPAHREHSFRFNVNTDSGHREHGFRAS